MAGPPGSSKSSRLEYGGGLKVCGDGLERRVLADPRVDVEADRNGGEGVSERGGLSG